MNLPDNITQAEIDIMSHGWYEGLQNCGSNHATIDPATLVYHVHGQSQYYGTCKYHKRLDCPVLRRWKPGKHLSKTVMRDWGASTHSVPQNARCKVCWK